MFPTPEITGAEPNTGRPSAKCCPDGTRLMFRITGRRLPRVNRYVAVSARSRAISRLIDAFAFREYRLAKSRLTVVMSWRVGVAWRKAGETVGKAGENGNCGID